MDERQRRNTTLLHWLTAPAVAYCLVAAAFYEWIDPRPFLVPLNLAAGAAVLINEAAFIRHRRVFVTQTVFAGIGVTVLVPMFVTGGVGGAGFAWYFAYLIFAYVLMGPRWGTVWASALLLVTAGVVATGLADPPYSTPFLIDASWAYFLSMFLVYMLNRAYERSQGRLEELAAIVASANDAILHVDPQGIVRSWNAAGERIFGYTTHEIVGRPAQILTPSDRIESERGLIERIIRGERVEHMETVRVRKDGAHLDVALSVSPIRNAKGAVVASAMVLRDVSESKRAEERERELVRLRSADELKNALLSTVSHELKTPLTPLKLQTQLLQSESVGPLNEKQRKSVNILRRNLDRLGGLVQQTLDVSRIQGGHLALDLKMTPLRPIIEEAVESYEETARTQGVALEVEGGEEIVAAVDAPRLSQVLFNLVSNALKFTPKGGSVRIRWARADGYVRVDVHDSGVGIDARHAAHLFQPFSRVEDAVTGKKEGTGLGLYISKGIIEAHGGAIGFRSDGDGRGSTFYFTLPHPASTGTPA